MVKVRNRIDLYDEISLRLKWGKSKTKGNKLGSRLKRVVKRRHWCKKKGKYNHISFDIISHKTHRYFQHYNLKL